MRRRLPPLYIENARLIFRNFAGREGKYNKAGDKNFCVIIDDPDLAKELSNDGWNVRILAPRDEEEEPRYYIKVNVSYRKFPPKITTITGRKKTSLDEESIVELDFADFVNVDLTISPSVWDRGDGDSGISGYLREMIATLEEDRWAEKYAYLDEGGNEASKEE